MIKGRAERYDNDTEGSASVQEAFSEGVEWADNNPAWISVKDEMPSPYKEVVLCFYTFGVDGTAIHDTCLGFWNREIWIASNYLDLQNKKIGANVTHWMPKPGLPKDLEP